MINVSAIIWIFKSLAITFSILWISLILLNSSILPAGMLYEVAEKLGTITEFTVFAAAGLWVVRNIWLQMKKRNISYVDFVKEIFYILKKHHIFLGVVAVIAAFGHGIFFMLHDTAQIRFYTGLGALIGINLVVFAGLLYRMIGKKQVKLYRKLHIFMVILFAVSLLIHLL